MATEDKARFPASLPVTFAGSRLSYKSRRILPRRVLGPFKLEWHLGDLLPSGRPHPAGGVIPPGGSPTYQAIPPGLHRDIRKEEGVIWVGLPRGVSRL
jgi:hypothetical protein